MPAEEDNNLDKELEKARREFKIRPRWSREQYEEALKALAKKHGMTVKEVERMLDEGIKDMEDNIEKLVAEDMAKMEADRKRREEGK